MASHLILCLLLTASVLFAQRPGRAMGAAQQTVQSGTASLAGKVLDSASGAPVKRAVVTVESEGENARPFRGLTSDDGSFVIGNLPKGKYWIVAEKTGYLRTAYRGRTPTSWGDPIEVSDGQSRSGVEVRMLRQGVIAGRVLDETGEPAERVMVQAINIRSTNTQRGPGSAAMTDDRGEFRIARLAPGNYKLLASRPERSGDVYVDRVPGRAATAEAPTYFPGTVDAASAAPIRVNAGEERTGAEIRLQRSVVVRVAGRVSGDLPSPQAQQEGRRAGGGLRVSLRPAGNTQGPMMDFFNRGGDGGVRADGSFEFQNIRPGEYTLIVSGFGRQGPLVMGRQGLSVGQQDLTNLNVTAFAPIKVDGRFRADGEPPFDFGKLTLNFAPASGGFPGPPLRATTDANASFSIPSVGRDRYRLEVQTPKGIYVKAIYAAGQPIPGFDLDFATISGPLEIVLSNKPARIQGTVEGAAPNSPRFAVWVAPDREPFALDPGAAKKIRVDPANPTFTVDSLRPGTYRVLAFENADSDAPNDVSFWNQFKDRSSSVTLSENEVGQLKLKLITAKEVDEN